ncbi:MAG: hypothetical protein ACI870_000410 [Crocinitomicaceae bacterium]|jgi:hypothetical protein
MVQPEKFLTVSYKYEATLNDWGKNKKIKKSQEIEKNILCFLN